MREVRRLVEEGQQFSSEYKGILATHLPMSLLALSGLGAEDARLTEFYHFYIKRLSPRPPKQGEVTRDTWTNFLGQHRLHAEYLEFFQKEIQAHGVEKTLATFLPQLLQSPGSGAFHGAIRTSYGVDFGLESEIAEGLAYWCLAYLPADRAAKGTTTNHSAMEIVKAALNDVALRLPPSGSNIIERMEKILASPVLAKYAVALATSDRTLEDLSATTLQLYAATDNFTVLHAVTGTHAVRLLLPFVADQATPVRCHWYDVLAAVLTVTITDEQKTAVMKCGESWLHRDTEETWEQIAANAITSNDDHVPKLVYTCLREEETYGWPLFRTVAARKAGIIGLTPADMC